MNELNHLNLQKRLKDRFFRYIAIESQSQEGVNEVPSTPGQWTLARLLMRDLETLGLQGISINEHGVVQAHLRRFSVPLAHRPDELSRSRIS
jgi:tripeptide aminopeptidase